MTKNSQKNHYLFDARGKILGRSAVLVAKYLYGKNKVDFSPEKDNSDYVTVINASFIKVTGNKIEEKTYYRHTGYPGGIKKETLKEALEKHPSRVFEKAVLGMLPKNKRAKEAFKCLRVYPKDKYPKKDNMKEIG